MAEGLDDTQEQELEELLRFNETLMRENELFESHLQRTAPALLAASAMPDDLRDFAPPDAMPAYDDDEAPSDED